MTIKPLWKAFREMLESAGYDHDLCPEEPTGWVARNALSANRYRVTPKPTLVVSFGVAAAEALGVAVFQANHLGAKAERSADEMRRMTPDQRQSAVEGDTAFRVVGMLRGESALGPWYLPGHMLGARVWVARDNVIAPDAVRIDMVVNGQIRRNVKPTNYSVAELRRSIEHYLTEAEK